MAHQVAPDGSLDGPGARRGGVGTAVPLFIYVAQTRHSRLPAAAAAQVTRRGGNAGGVCLEGLSSSALLLSLPPT